MSGASSWSSEVDRLMQEHRSREAKNADARLVPIQLAIPFQHAPSPSTTPCFSISFSCSFSNAKLIRSSLSLSLSLLRSQIRRLEKSPGGSSQISKQPHNTGSQARNCKIPRYKYYLLFIVFFFFGQNLLFIVYRPFRIIWAGPFTFSFGFVAWPSWVTRLNFTYSQYSRICMPARLVLFK